MKQTKEPTWVVNVAEGTTKGVYRGFWVKVKNMVTHQEVYIDGIYYMTVETQSPVKAVNAAMEAIDKELT